MMWCRLAAVLSFTLLCGCSALSSAAPLPPIPPEIMVTMEEYEFHYSDDVPGGRVVFRFVNAGSTVHRPVLVPLPDDLPPISAQLAGSERRALAPFAGVPSVQPGESSTFAASLVRGTRYALICFASDHNGEVHAMKGMSSEFRAREPRAEDFGV